MKVYGLGKNGVIKVAYSHYDHISYNIRHGTWRPLRVYRLPTTWHYNQLSHWWSLTKMFSDETTCTSNWIHGSKLGNVLYIFYIYTWYMHIFSLLPVLKAKIIPLRPIPKTNPAQHWLKNKTCKVVTPTLWTSAAPLTYTETFPSDLCSKMVYVHWMTQGL